jgi:oxygen-independent coproporphyrinogen III oxidase
MIFHPAAPADQVRYHPERVFQAGLSLHHIANTAYPIGHLNTMRPYRVPTAKAQTLAPLAWQPTSELGLYVHIPFCEQRCGYCEYCVIDPALNAANEDTYFDALIQEFDLYRRALGDSARTLQGFDIGGGTPSAVDARQIARVMEAARRCFDLPDSVTVSIETTPRLAARQPEKLHIYYALGIRRVSMGIQTINPRLLSEMGRDSTSLRFNRQAAEAVRAAGFERFNVDVMYGFANQSLASLEATLRHAVSLAPEYITLYRVRYKGTRIEEQSAGVTRAQVTAQARLAKALLLAAGYHGTPGKNTFSRRTGDPGTSDYLTGRVISGTPYLGLGLGAQSLSETTLAYNAGAADKRLEHYLRRVASGRLPLQDLYHLSREAAVGKMVSVSFYFGEVKLEAFRAKFGVDFESLFLDEVAFVLQQGYMEMLAEPGGRVLRLTEVGEDVYNGVIALFYAGAVKAHLFRLLGWEEQPSLPEQPRWRTEAAGVPLR